MAIAKVWAARLWMCDLRSCGETYYCDDPTVEDAECPKCGTWSNTHNGAESWFVYITTSEHM